MKLQELAVVRPSSQAAKVFESYFGQRLSIDSISAGQASKMLNRVRSLVREHRSTSEFHRSEQNPTYLKLVMLEQALSARLKEEQMAQGMSAQQSAADAAKNRLMAQQQKKQIQDAIKQKQMEIQQLQKQLSTATLGMAESKRGLREASEIQQAQVVLASQDMVDQVQKMSEQVSAMQFKDLPALVDQIKNEVGVDQATQFNGDASAALSGLLQNLGGAKQQLEAALGVVTGNAPSAIPGDELGGDLGAEPGLDAAADLDAELPPELPAPGEEEEEEDISVTTDLGRDRR